MLWNRALLYFIQKKEQPEEPVIEWVVDVETQRGNKFIIDNENKTVTIYKTVTSSGSPLHMNFEPIVMDGYTAIKPDELKHATSDWWYCPNTWNNKGVRKVAFDIVIENTTEVAATYTLLLDWNSTGEV